MGFPGVSLGFPGVSLGFPTVSLGFPRVSLGFPGFPGFPEGSLQFCEALTLARASSQNLKGFFCPRAAEAASGMSVSKQAIS